MFSLQDDNIHNLAIEGVFDDCQDIVKSVSADLDFKRRHRIGAVNSINWARVVAQVVYYFAGYLQVSAQGVTEVDFTVPSGNFGNICAGHVARMMGLPIRRIVIATNENDVLDEFFRTGRYRPRGRVDTQETSSPSMDISKASNLERFVFDLLGRDAARTKALFYDQLRAHGHFDLGGDRAFGQAATVFGFESGKSTHADRLTTIRDVWLRHESVVDPHTADGITVARRFTDPQRPMIVLETALPVKFAATIHEALNRMPDCPGRFIGIEDLPQRLESLPADAEMVKRYIETVVHNSAITNQPDAHRWDQRLETLATPCLILDRDRMDCNVARLRTRLQRLGPNLRPHLKTAKSPDAEGGRGIRRRWRH
jgi:threonine synthase